MHSRCSCANISSDRFQIRARCWIELLYYCFSVCVTRIFQRTILTELRRRWVCVAMPHTRKWFLTYCICMPYSTIFSVSTSLYASPVVSCLSASSVSFGWSLRSHWWSLSCWLSWPTGTWAVRNRWRSFTAPSDETWGNVIVFIIFSLPPWHTLLLLTYGAFVLMYHWLASNVTSVARYNFGNSGTWRFKKQANYSIGTIYICINMLNISHFSFITIDLCDINNHEETQFKN